ncbi:MAG TPA: hypothetical protein VGJ59_09445 [Jatrophihabitantaceae bacterium]|jgi:hypothetical protein
MRLSAHQIIGTVAAIDVGAVMTIDRRRAAPAIHVGHILAAKNHLQGAQLG